jgi:2'-hydroxyisoflavone reductase
MHLLIVGGTKFLGRHIAAQALAAGHRLTLLHRGQSGPGLFPEAEHLIADRNGDLSLLRGRRFDVVIDTSAYVPRQVRSLAAALAEAMPAQYQFVSSISAYAAFAASNAESDSASDAAGTNEDAPLATLSDPATEVIDGNTYGGLKAACEAAALQSFDSGGVRRCVLVRPGLIVGPHDPSGRFTWWVRRADAQPAALIVPGDAESPVQFIDARDLAAWMLGAAATHAPLRGAYNLTGPATALTMGAFVAALRDVLAPQARLQPRDEALLLAQGVAPWTELPVWLPAASAALHRVDIGRALASGLAIRPLADTLRDTAAWARTAPEHGLRPGVGLSAEREAALLALER